MLQPKLSAMRRSKCRGIIEAKVYRAEAGVAHAACMRLGQLHEWVVLRFHFIPGVVLRPDEVKGFKLLPHRWVTSMR
jgi:hypothetical protein